MTWDHRKKFQKANPSELQADEHTANSHRGTDTFTCPGCGMRTSGAMAYCPQCGYVLSQSCPCCGHQWRYEYEYSFCPGCGAELPTGQSERQENNKPRRGPVMRAGKVIEYEEEIR